MFHFPATWTWCVVSTLIHSKQKLFSIRNNNKCNWQIAFAGGNYTALFSNNETANISLLIKVYKLKKKKSRGVYLLWLKLDNCQKTYTKLKFTCNKPQNDRVLCKSGAFSRKVSQAAKDNYFPMVGPILIFIPKFVLVVVHEYLQNSFSSGSYL